MLKKVFFFLILLVFVSCNFHIEKRKYFKGYHVEIAKIKHSSINQENNSNTNLTDIIYNSNASIAPAVINSNGLAPTSSSSNHLKQESSKDLKGNVNIIPADVLNLKSAKPKTTFSKKIKSKASFRQVKGTKSKIRGNGYLLGVFSIMAIALIGLAKRFQQILLKISNWAIKNKLKTKILIGVLQTSLALLGIGIGNAFNDLGYNLSPVLSYLFTGTLLLAIIALVKQKKSSKTEPLKVFFRNKVAHGTIGLSSLMLMSVVGNHVGTNNPTNSTIGYVIEKNHFGLIDKHTINANQDSVKDDTIDKTVLISIYAFLGILMALVLMALTCAVWCWAILSGEVGILAIAIVATACLVLIAVYVISAMKRSVDDRYPPLPLE